jgi:hypothetical protein
MNQQPETVTAQEFFDVEWYWDARERLGALNAAVGATAVGMAIDGAQAWRYHQACEAQTDEMIAMMSYLR